MLNAATIKSKVTEGAQLQYLKDTRRIFGLNSSNKLLLPVQAEEIIAIVRQAKTKSTLRKYAHAVRHFVLNQLGAYLRRADAVQRNNDWMKVNSITSAPSFTTLIKLTEMLPADYALGWVAEKKRKGKKSFLLKLPKDWREKMAEKSTGQYRVPMLVTLMTGCRPVELEYSVSLR